MEFILIWPWNGYVLIPPSSGNEGNIEPEDKTQRNQIHECGTKKDDSFEYPKIISNNTEPLLELILSMCNL